MAKILLIEPDRVLAGAYFQALNSAGHHVTAASTAQGAIMAADQVQPDAVILELQLIGHSGIEFLYEFRSYSDWQEVPVIIQSNVPPAEFVGSQELLKDQLGAHTYLYKLSTSLQQLIDATERVLPVKA